MKFSPEQIRELNIKIGQKITFMYLNGACFTVKTEAKIISVQNDKLTYKEKGKRMEKRLPLSTETMIFDGWNIPLNTEMDKSNDFFMDAQMNLWGDAAEIKEYIEANNLNPYLSEYTKAQIVAVTPSEGEENKRVEVYPTDA